MSWAVAFGPCLACGQPFGFNPRRVPSHDGEPICESCMQLVNKKREEAGLPEWPVPDDAYEPLPSHEL